MARHLYKLTAYKDEYEVARLHLRPGVGDAVRDAVGDFAGYRILLHPPVLRAMGLKRKISLGPFQRPALAVLKGLRRLRGTPLGRVRLRRGPPDRTGADRRVPGAHGGRAGRP